MTFRSLRPGERIALTDTISLVIVTVRGTKVTLGIEAPPAIPVRRAEVLERRLASPPAPA